MYLYKYMLWGKRKQYRLKFRMWVAVHVIGAGFTVIYTQAAIMINVFWRTKKGPRLSWSKNREDKIRTCDPYVPNVVLYQAELLPGKAEDGIRTRDPHHGKVMFYHWTTSAWNKMLIKLLVPCRLKDSNLRPPVYKTDALPTELSRQKYRLEPPIKTNNSLSRDRLELSTHWLKVSCSTNWANGSMEDTGLEPVTLCL